MKKLKNVLQYDIFYIILILITSLISFIIIKSNIYYKKINSNSNVIQGTILNIKRKNNINILDVKIKYKVRVLVYDNSNSKYLIGDKVKVYGKLKKINSNTNFYLFNYKNYLASFNTYYMMNTRSIKVIKKGSFLYNLKNKVIKKINKYHNSYFNAFILGDNSLIDTFTKTSYQTNGISHLFAISGMHVGIFITILSFILKLLKVKHKNVFIIIFLLFYLFLTNFSKSIVRTFLLFVGIKINKTLNLNLSNAKIIIIIFCLSLIHNPYNIYNTSFLFTHIVTFSIFINKDLIEKYDNYFIKIFIISLISFISVMPIVINSYHQLNFLSIILNLLYIPYVSLIVFPLSIISVFIPQLLSVFNLLIIILEKSSLIFEKINIFKITLCHININVFIIYYIIIYLLFILKKNYILIILILILVVHSNYRYFDSNIYVNFLDVGQGDSILINLPNNKSNILIDTGIEQKQNIIINSLKSRGVKKLNYLIISHGDQDHCGEAINLVNNFKVEKVIFNCGPYNELEKELIKVLDKKKIKYYSCIKELNIDNNKLQFLQTKVYDNENDNSNVIITELDGYKFIFMGDASTATEKEILSKYDLPDVDVLKAGHHGSKTSSSREFINELNPNYSIISVGKNNRYGHPNKEVLDNLKNSKIYRTDQDGSIMFKIKNNNLKIETCST